MIIAGIGLRKDATLDSLRTAFSLTGVEKVDGIATPSDKADHPAVVEFARDLGVPIHRIETSDLVAQSTQTQSERVMAKRGTGSVAEAAALAAVGANGVLRTARAVSVDRMATCAIASGDDA